MLSFKFWKVFYHITGIVHIKLPEKLEDGLHFALQFVDAMRNEYIQEYEMKRDVSHILIDCGYPAFLEQR